MSKQVVLAGICTDLTYISTPFVQNVTKSTEECRLRLALKEAQLPMFRFVR